MEETKFDLDKDIIMQIEMDSYMKYNDTIALMNDRLGEMYGYSDVKDMEEVQLKYEKKLAYKAIKDLQEKVEQLDKENKELNRMCEIYSQSLYNADLKKAEQEVDRLNNIINGIEAYLKMAIAMNFNMNNSKLQDQIVENYTNILNNLKQLKDSD